MKIEETFNVPETPETVWRFITDPVEVGPCVPGLSNIEVVGPDKYKAKVKVAVGPIKAAFNFEVEVTKETPPSEVLSVTRGEEGSKASKVTAHNILRLSPSSDGTEVYYSSEVSITGRLGKFGFGVMKKKAKSLGEEFAENFRQRIETSNVNATESEAIPAPTIQTGENKTMGKANWQDMREFMDALEERGELVRISEEVDPAWEINGLTRIGLQDRGPALLFENIKGADFPMVANLLGTDERYLFSLGIDKWSDYNEEWIRRTEEFIPPRMVDSGPCQEEVIEGDDIDLHKICNTVWHQFDAGEFPGTLGISITRGRNDGVLNAGIYRMHTLSNNTLGWGAPEYTHGRQHYMEYEHADEEMPMAVVTGYDPVVFIMGATRTPPGIDEFHIGGALRGEAIDMVASGADGIPVPATSEFVFEGVIKPHHREIEGGFGEYTGYYGEARSNPAFEVRRITHRKKPIFLGAREQWEPSDSTLVNGKSSQAEAFKTVKSLVPGVLDMRCNVCFEAIVKIDKLFPGHPQQVMDAVWGGTYSRYKHVIIVDKDVDIWDYTDVHWALSTNVRADRDVTISPRRAGQWLDPAVSLREKGWQTQMGIDATLCTEEYEFWGEKSPRLVDDPEIVAKTLDKWGDKLSWRKS